MLCRLKKRHTEVRLLRIPCFRSTQTTSSSVKSELAPVSVSSVFAPVALQPRVVECLTAEDVAQSSIEAINMLVPHRPDLVAQAVILSGRRRRGELAYPMQSLKPMARFILLAGMNRRAEQLSEADAIFLARVS